MSVLDKISFLKSIIPSIIEILTIVIKCLRVIIDYEGSPNAK